MNELEEAMQKVMQEKGQEIYNWGYDAALVPGITTRSDGACCLVLAMDADFVFVLGEERIKLIYSVILNGFGQNLYKSKLAAMSGALRWTPAMRPEVLIDAKGRML